MKVNLEHFFQKPSWFASLCDYITIRPRIANMVQTHHLTTDLNSLLRHRSI